MRKLICLFAVLSFAGACNRKMPMPSEAEISADSIKAVTSVSAISGPPCILQKIDSLLHEPVWNPPAEIYEYNYKGKKVYAISSNCCDQFHTVVDSACNYICAPSGGFTGRGDGKCADFFKAAKQIRMVWKDERKR